MAAEEILGISGQMDISDIQASLDKLCDGLNRVGVDTEALSQRMTKALNDIAQSDGDLASKTQQAMNVLKSAMDEATKGIKVVPEMIDTANKKVETIEGTIGKLNDELAKTDKTSNAFTSITKQIEAQKQSLQLAKEDVTDLTNSYANVKNVLSEVGGAYEALNAFSAASSTANGAQTVSNVAVGASATAAATATTAEAAAHTANAAAALGNADAESQNAQATQQLTAALQEYMSVASGRAEVERMQSESAKELKSDMKMYEETIKDIQTVLATSDFGGKIEDATKRIEYQKHIIEQYKEALANLSEGEKSGGTATYYNENIEVAKKKIEELQAKIGEWQHEQERLNNDLQEYNTLLDAAKKIQAGENLTGGFKKATEEAKNTAKETENIGKEAEKAGEKTADIFSKLKGALGGAMKGDFSGLLGLFGKAGWWGAAITGTIAVSKEIENLSKTAQELAEALIPLKAYVDGGTLEELRQQFVALEYDSSHSAEEMAAGATRWVKYFDGIRGNADAIAEVTKSSNDFATVLGTTTEKAADYQLKIAGAYHQTALEAKENSTVIINATKNGTAKYEEMAQALAQTANRAQNAGVSFKELAAATTYGTSAFGSASEAANAYVMMMTRLSTQSKSEYNPTVVGATEALQNLAKSHEMNATLTSLLGKRQASLAKVFVQGAASIKQMQGGLDDEASAAKTLAGAESKLDEQEKRLANAKRALAHEVNMNLTPAYTAFLNSCLLIVHAIGSISSAIKKSLSPVVTSIGNAVDWINKKISGTFIGKILNVGTTKALSVISPTMSGLKILMDYDQKNIHQANLEKAFKENLKKYGKSSPGKAYLATLKQYTSSTGKYAKSDKAYLQQLFRRTRTEGQSRTKGVPLQIGDQNKVKDTKGDNKQRQLEQQQRQYRETEAEQQAKELAKAEKTKWDLYLAEKESGIARLESASEKEAAQHKLDYEKQKHAIEEEQKSMLSQNVTAAKQVYDKNPDNKKKEGFYASGLDKKVTLTSDQKALINAKYEALEAKENAYDLAQLKQKTQSLYDYLKEYGTFKERQLAITREYEGKIQEAERQGNVAESARLKEELDKQIKELNFSDFKNSINWDAVFSDMSRLSVSYLEELRKKLKELLGSGTLSVNDMKAVSEQITNIDEAVSKQKDQWGLANDKVREHKRLLEEVVDAQNELQNAQTDLAAAQVGVTDKKMQIQSILTTAGISVGVGDITYQSKDALLDNDSIKKSSSRTEALRKLFDELAISETKVAKATENVVKAQSKVKLKEEQSKWDTDDVANTVSNALGKVLDKLKDLPELVSVLGLGNTGFGRAVNNGMSALGSAKSAADSFASGNYIGAAMNGIKAISSLGKVFGIGTGNGAEVAKTTQKLTESNERLQYSIEQLKSSIDKSSGMNAVSNYDKAYEAQKQINKQSMEILQTQMGYHGAHHSNAYYWNLSAQDYAAINKTLAQQEGVRGGYVNSTINKVSSLEDIYKLTPEQMADIRTYNQDVWKTMTDQGKYDKTSYWENYTELAGKLEELTERINENLTQVSFSSMEDDFFSNLMDMEKDAQDFANDFATMMQKSVLRFGLEKLIDTDLKKLYEKWGAKMQEGNLTKDDIDNLKSEYEDIVSKGLEQRDYWAEITGYKESQSQQSATGKAIEAITADQASSLVGIGYGVLSAVEVGNETRKAIQVDISSLRTFSEQTANNIEEMRDIQYQGLEQLQAINKNTYNLFAMKDDLADLKKIAKDYWK